MTKDSLTIVAYGGGTDSTAVLIEMIRRKEPPPYAVLFADTGGEQPHTYTYVDLFSRWLVSHGYPAITIVRALRRSGQFESLEAACIRLRTLPAKAFGFKSCSLHYKVEPQKKWRNNDPAVRAEWAAGRAITQIIGYEKGEEHRVVASGTWKIVNRYPLIEWGLDRDACLAAIQAAGLPLPGKSSCFFCPSMRKPEITALGRAYPDLLARALALEANVDRDKVSVIGLGRRFSWTDYIAGLATAATAYDEPCSNCYDGDDELSLEDLARFAEYIATVDFGVFT